MIVIVIGLVFFGALVWTWVFCFPNPSPPLDELTQTGCNDGFKQIGPSVKSFLSGAHDPLESKESLKFFEGLIGEIDKIKIGNKGEQGCPLPMVIFVVGATDRRHLKGKLELTYGGNAGLARGRSEYIAEEIRRSFPAVPVLSLITGSSWHGSENDPKKEGEMASDRSVTVYGLWAVKPVKGSVPAR